MLSVFAIGTVFLLFGRVWSETPVLQPKGFAFASNYFGFNFYRQLSAENFDGKNIFFSPFSLATALAMIHQGAEGDTEKQLGVTLGFAEAGLKNPGIEIQQTTEMLKGSPNDETYAFKSANALLITEESAVKESYKNVIQNTFEAKLFTANFSSKSTETMNLINSWVSKQTAGKIPTLLDQPPSSDTVLALLNAVYFQGHWKAQFRKSKTKPAPFYSRNNIISPGVKFMERYKVWKVVELNDLASMMLEMPYAHGNVSFLAILPNELNSTLDHIQSALTPSYIETAISQLCNSESTVVFPKFSYQTKYELAEVLAQLGLSDLFSDKANLKGISDATTLKVSKVKQSTTIKVDEQGSTASASTYFEMGKRIGSLVGKPVYRFDHPFVFLIRHQPTGQILFLGELNQL